jgi:hypothetical protein
MTPSFVSRNLLTFDSRIGCPIGFGCENMSLTTKCYLLLVPILMSYVRFFLFFKKKIIRCVNAKLVAGLMEKCDCHI